MLQEWLPSVYHDHTPRRGEAWWFVCLILDCKLDSWLAFGHRDDAVLWPKMSPGHIGWIAGGKWNKRLNGWFALGCLLNKARECEILKYTKQIEAFSRIRHVLRFPVPNLQRETKALWRDKDRERVPSTEKQQSRLTTVWSRRSG